MRAMSIQTRYGSLADRIEKACLSAGRDPREVTFVAVSKTVGPDEVAQAFSAGARNFGENRPGLLEKHRGSMMPPGISSVSSNRAALAISLRMPI